MERAIRKIIKKIKLKRIKETRDVKEISYEELKRLLKSDIAITIVDIRSPQEFAEGRIKFAINIPLYELNKKAQILLPNKDKLTILYCTTGIRSKKACEVLEEKGYTNIYSLAGGLDGIN